MAQAQMGDTVQVHYTGKLEDGQVFDTSGNREPLQFTIGGGQIIPGFEEAVAGMDPGETKTARIPADKAYGPHREELIVEVDRGQFPEHLAPEVGQRLAIRQADGSQVPVTVTDVSESSVQLDGNHPLAGKDLTFDIQLVKIV
ncbi:MAG: peptidylprolyl isomerase [Ardenticatenaceae bacterium]|nr:peptidylprolyl isomerase [Ardenticatenaceae bacterium]HBY95209.1 peptidylprolyl isomerase [Chloroflexota bacterium]